MPRRQTEPEPADDAVVECIVPHATTDPETGLPVIVQHGQKVRTGHFTVVANPGWFCSPDQPHAERAHWRDWIGAGITTTAPPRKPDGWRPR